jgi:hypothetical protein
MEKFKFIWLVIYKDEITTHYNSFFLYSDAVEFVKYHQLERDYSIEIHEVEIK